MAVPLDGGDEPVTLGERVQLRAPGLVGAAELRPTGRALAAAGPPDEGPSYLELALANASLTPRATVAVASSAQSAGDSTVAATPIAPDRRVVLLSRDPAGLLRWHLPETGAGTTMAADQSFRVPSESLRPSGAATADAGATAAEIATSSPIGSGEAAFLTLLEFPVGAVVAGAYAQWERFARPSVATWFPPKHGLLQGVALTDANWRTLAEGRTLLFLHGIFSTSASAFDGLLDTSRPDVTALWEHLDSAYDGRIIAFDHPTASVAPEQNVEDFLALIPSDVHLDLDIVCHSRGGLVARILDGQLTRPAGSTLLDVLWEPLQRWIPGPEPRADVTVHKIVFVGTPNGGTAVVEEQNWNTLVDSITTLLRAPLGPWSATTPVLEGVIELVKSIAAGAVEDLPGLRVMDPDDKLYRLLDQWAGNAPLYYSVEADFEPGPGSDDVVGNAVDELIDPVFHDRANDVAVPAAGVGDPASVRPAGARPPHITGFPVPADRRLTFDPGLVWHLNYFHQEATREALRQWLP